MAEFIGGLVSGLDTESIIAKLMQIERRPILLKQSNLNRLSQEKEAWNKIESKMDSLDQYLYDIKSFRQFSSLSARLINDSGGSGDLLTAYLGSAASEGSYDIEIISIAKGQKSISNTGYSSPDVALGIDGTFTITNVSSSEQITLTADMSLDDIKTAINDKNLSISAKILNTGSYNSPLYKLILENNQTGDLEGAFSTSFIPNAGSNDFLFDILINSADASLKIDDVLVARSENEINDLIPNVTLNIEKPGSLKVVIEKDNDAIRDKVVGFIDKYNDLIDELSKNIAYDKETKTQAALTGNFIAKSILDRVKSIATSKIEGIDITDTERFAALSQLGIKTDSSGKLIVDEAKLEGEIAANSGAVIELFVPSARGDYEFVSADYRVTSGEYDTRVVDISGTGDYRLELKLAGSSTWITMEQDGEYAKGPEGSSVENLILKTGVLDSSHLSDTGNLSVAIGMVESLRARLDGYTESSESGAIYNQKKSIDSRDKALKNDIDKMSLRISLKEEMLKQKFAALESILSNLTAKQQYLEQQIPNLTKNWK